MPKIEVTVKYIGYEDIAITVSQSVTILGNIWCTPISIPDMANILEDMTHDVIARATTRVKKLQKEQ